MTLSTYTRLEAAAIVLSIGLALASASACIWLAKSVFWELVFLVGSVVPYLLIVNFLMKGYVWRNLAVNKVDQPAGLISVLLDRSRDFGDRHDAASDLVFYWYAPEVTDALMKVREDPAEDPDIIEEAQHSLSDIRRRQSGI